MGTKVLSMLCLMGMSCTSSQEVQRRDDALLHLVQERRSIRRYTDAKVERSLLEKIVKVGMFAPSSYGQNPVEFVIVDEKEKLETIARAKRIGAPSVRAASAAIVVAVDTSKGELWIEDSSVAAGYILLAAEHYGVGACWNQIRDREGQQASAGEEIRKILGIPSRYAVLCVISLGYKAEHKTPHTEDELDMRWMHYNEY